jgi:hypothetical protein
MGDYRCEGKQSSFTLVYPTKFIKKTTTTAAVPYLPEWKKT